MVEGVRLESGCTLTRTAGSNPALSAMLSKNYKHKRKSLCGFLVIYNTFSSTEKYIFRLSVRVLQLTCYYII